jgi:hypothetical protein
VCGASREETCGEGIRAQGDGENPAPGSGTKARGCSNCGERVRSGIAVARAQGKRIGRPPRPVDAARVAELRARGWSLGFYRQIDK